MDATMFCTAKARKIFSFQQILTMLNKTGSNVRHNTHWSLKYMQYHYYFTYTFSTREPCRRI